MKILIFTDSRGQHITKGAGHQVYGDMLSSLHGIEVEAYYCPFKWTTTADFLVSFNRKKLLEYDLVLLQTGIVDFSPRTQSSANFDLYENIAEENKENLALNTRDYSKKIKNHKKRFFDKIFGESSMKEHLQNPIDSYYNGEKTNNMYSLEMARIFLIPLLNNIPNLLYINTNKIVKDWNGDYPRERPTNMSLIHDYCDLFSKEITNCIDLSVWNESEIQKYTTDNVHLTEEGNRFIFNSVLEHIKRGKDKVEENRITKSIPPFWPKSRTNTDFSDPEIINKTKRLNILSSYQIENIPIATLVVGFRLKNEDRERLQNLRTFLEWIRKFYKNLFEIILVEQDEIKKFDENLLENGERYEFLYNPKKYNRGWGYNVAVKHFVKTNVVVTCDTDVLFGKSFLSSVLQCYRGKEFVSPYRNVYYTNENEAKEIQKDCSISRLNFEESRLKNPVSITGGVCIFTKDAYLRLGGYEQYIGYSCEDRSFDVAICELVDADNILIQNETYVHLWHPLGKEEKINFEQIYSHLVTNYGCKYHPELKFDSYIHEFCNHASAAKIRSLIQYRSKSSSWGDAKLYSNPSLEINGLSSEKYISRLKKEKRNINKIIFPSDFTNLNDYEPKETYANVSKPSAELESFYNKYKGQRCIIIGNGPSLNKIDLGRIQNEYTFGVNSLYYKTNENGFLPTFFVVEDSSVMKENIAEIKSYNAPYKFFPTIYKNLHGEKKNTFFFKMNRGFYEKSSPNFCVPRFSTDFSKVAFCGQSVTYINLQLAYFMGFTEVYLVGMDFAYTIPESHTRKGDVLLSDTDDPNHFHKNYFGKGKTWKDPKLERVLMNYKQAKLSFESCGRQIINATHGGNLELFPRVNYNSVFQYDLGDTYLCQNSKIKVLTDSERIDTVKKAKDLILLNTNLGLIKLDERHIEFGLTDLVKKVRLRSIKKNEATRLRNVNLISQKVEISDLLESGCKTTSFLVDIKLENRDWINLGLLNKTKRWFSNNSQYEISDSSACVSSKFSEDRIVCLFKNGKKREIVELLTDRESESGKARNYERISPIKVGHAKVIGFKAN
jgi:hypothetical protein